MTLSFFATSPKGLEDLLALELAALGASQVKATRSGVRFAGPLDIGYRACLWSRVASRVLLVLRQDHAADADALYELARGVPWSEHLTATGTLAVDFVGRHPTITHPHFGAVRVKDAIVDRFRAEAGERPSVDAVAPDVRVNVFCDDEAVTLSLDLSGESLHRRGYRAVGVAAPLKENLAAGLLLRARWPEQAASGAVFLDPMCGSGTFPIEAALMAGDIAPGSLGRHFGFERWLGHDASTWRSLRDEAAQRRLDGAARLPRIVGCDGDGRAVAAALKNVERAGLASAVHVERMDLERLDAVRFFGEAKGLLVVNPPYGVRLGAREGSESSPDVTPVYAALGRVLRERFGGWTACVLTDQGEHTSELRLRASRRHTVHNGPIACWFLTFDIQLRTGEELAVSLAGARKPSAPGAEDFVNRLKKNARRLGRWAERAGVSCYRVYDADLPDFAAAIDVYERWVHVQEYAPPKTVEPRVAQRRLEAIVASIPEVLQVRPEDVFLKVRQRQKGNEQYERRPGEARFCEVREGGHRFLVNFTNYLDTGLFLDHRLTRARLAALAPGVRFLNLFAYTGTATVYAAKGGARSTTSVDLSGTYLDWAERNFELNGLSPRSHRLERADCMSWLAEASERYDLIFADPPTFSNSKRTDEVFDVQRDHVELIERCMRLLAPGGLLVFSNNFRKFVLDAAALSELTVQDVTASTIPEDFARNPRIHRCYEIRRR